MTNNKNGFVWRGLAALLLVGLIVVGAFAAHYVGWSQGYAAGRLTAEGEEAATLPYLLPGLGRPFEYTPYPFGVALLLKIGLLLLFFAVIGKILRLAVWGIAGGPPLAGPWGRYWCRSHWRWRHGPMPSRFHDWQEWHDREAGKPEPGTQTDEAAA